MLRDVNVRSMYMLVGADKMVADYRSKELWRGDGILLGENVTSLLLCVCSYYHGIVGFGVPGFTLLS